MMIEIRSVDIGLSIPIQELVRQRVGRALKPFLASVSAVECLLHGPAGSRDASCWLIVTRVGAAPDIVVKGHGTRLDAAVQNVCRSLRAVLGADRWRVRMPRARLRWR